jgi:hypothetical protein
MSHPLSFLIIVVLPILGVLLVQYFRTGSMVGALVGGRVRETVGEMYLDLARRPLLLRVQILEALGTGQPIIALTVNRQGDLGRFRIVRLDRDRAQELAELLVRAARSGLTHSTPESSGRWR